MNYKTYTKVDYCLNKKDADNLPDDVRERLAKDVENHVRDTVARAFGMNPLHLFPFDEGSGTVLDGEYKVVEK